MTAPTDQPHWAQGRLTLSLWFDHDAEQAWELYSSLFADARLDHVARYGPDEMCPEGQVRSMGWHLNGLDIMAINGGPTYSFTPAISLVAPCETQEEIDRLWAALTDGGKGVQCGWLEDRFGLSWQVVPARLGEWIGHPDPEAAHRATQAMLKMVKLEIAPLEAAAHGT